MRSRPLALFFSALLFSYFPVAMVWEWGQGNPFSWLDVVLSGVLPMVLIFGLLRVTKTGWYTLIAVVALWGVRDLYEYYSQSDSSVTSLLIHLAIYCVSLGYFINPRVRHLYFDPKLRWWRQKPRYETHMPFLMAHESAWHYPVLRNISEGGCFIETPHLLDVGAIIRIAIPLPVPLSVPVIHTEGEVRWVSANPLRHGMGVQFKEPRGVNEKAIREYVFRQL